MIIFLQRKDGSGRVAVQYAGSMDWIGRGAITANAEEAEKDQKWLEDTYGAEMIVPPDAFAKAVRARFSAFM